MDNLRSILRTPWLWFVLFFALMGYIKAHPIKTWNLGSATPSPEVKFNTKLSGQQIPTTGKQTPHIADVPQIAPSSATEKAVNQDIINPDSCGTTEKDSRAAG
jgi:hypothetical protein